MAKDLKLKEHQIYKWFWDTNKKVEEDNQLAAQIDQRLSASGSATHQKLVVLGTDGHGETLTPQ